MALNARQQRAYRDTCNIWTVTRDPNTDGGGTPGAETWSLAASAVAYMHQTTPNIDDPTDIGRMIRPTILTTDIGHFDHAQAVPDGAIIKNTTSGSGLNGFYEVLGPARSIPNHGNRRANKRSVMIRLLENGVPAGVS